ncbi:MAG: helix-turn-helix domain-containing protein [Lentilitoribacter sp.]
MKPKSSLLRPPKNLSSCIAAGVLRDTRGSHLRSADRYNYFPANPLVAISFVMEGALQTFDFTDEAFDLNSALPMPRFSKIVSTNHPVMSWGEADIFAITISFYPDAWAKLCATIGEEELLNHLHNMFLSLDAAQHQDGFWSKICETILPLWQKSRENNKLPDWVGSDRLSDWSHFLLARLMTSETGKSLRTIERRFKYWTGISKRQINHYASIETLHDLVTNNPDLPLAELALTSGYADQSHMGREVKRVTGFSPAKINYLIKTAEPFWCYRLLGERF